jgi:hypothetical protein
LTHFSLHLALVSSISQGKEETPSPAQKKRNFEGFGFIPNKQPQLDDKYKRV